MTAIDLLKQQHDEVDRLFKDLEKASDANERKRLFGELARNLVAHDAIEREIFYPACEKYMGMIEPLAEALTEHGLVEFSLYQADQAQGKTSFEAKLAVLKEVVTHHVKEEENTLFPKVRKAIGDEVLENIGFDLDERFEEVKVEDFRAGLYDTLLQVMEGALKTGSKKRHVQRRGNGGRHTATR